MKLQTIGIRLTQKEKLDMQRQAHLNFKPLSEYARDLVKQDNE